MSSENARILKGGPAGRLFIFYLISDTYGFSVF